MRIFCSNSGGDPMLLDTEQGLKELHSRLLLFVDGCTTEAEFPALTHGSPDPYNEFLPGIRLIKTSGAVQLEMADDRWLELSGPGAELRSCASKFVVSEEQGHRHLYTCPISLIIEADEYYESDNTAGV